MILKPMDFQGAIGVVQLTKQLKLKLRLTVLIDSLDMDRVGFVKMDIELTKHLEDIKRNYL